MEFLEIPLVDDDILKLGVRFIFNLFFLTLFVRYAITPNQSDREFVFTAVMMNITVFFICFSMKKLELGLGMALGLFAIFGILRYRTDTIRTKEMTYLFILIGIAVINSLSNKKTSYLELVAVNTIIFSAAMLKERFVAKGQAIQEVLESQRQLKNTIDYDRIELLGQDRRGELLADLRERTGIAVENVQIRNIDLQNSTSILTIYYTDPNGAPVKNNRGK